MPIETVKNGAYKRLFIDGRRIHSKSETTKAVKSQKEKAQEERIRVNNLRRSPMGVDTFEEIINDDHAIVSSSIGPEYYISILSFVDKDLLKPGCSILLHHKVMSVVGVL
jgi:26S proteasome regulatory subunit T2